MKQDVSRKITSVKAGINLKNQPTLWGQCADIVVNLKESSEEFFLLVPIKIISLSSITKCLLKNALKGTQNVFLLIQFKDYMTHSKIVQLTVSINNITFPLFFICLLGRKRSLLNLLFFFWSLTISTLYSWKS